MSASIKPWILLVGIFAIGVITGGALTFGLSARFERPRIGDNMRADWVTFMSQRLDLTPEQRAKIQPIIKDASLRIRTLHREEIQQGSQIIKTANDQVRALLTPEQQIRFQKMEEEREKMFNNRIRNWGPPREGPPGSSPRDGDQPRGPGPFDPNMGGMPNRPPDLDQRRQQFQQRMQNDPRMHPPAGVQNPTNVPPPPEEK